MRKLEKRGWVLRVLGLNETKYSGETATSWQDVGNRIPITASDVLIYASYTSPAGKRFLIWTL